MTQAILTAMAQEFREDRSLCPRTYRALRAVVQTHAEGTGGIEAADQVVNSEAKAAITHQTHLGNRTPAALAPCTDDHLSTENGEIMNAQKDRPDARAELDTRGKR